MKRIQYRKQTGVPDPVDVHVGGRVKLRRTLLGLSQEELADAVGVTFQQIQKYERGTNRMGASRLFDMATVLDVPVSYFYQDIPRKSGPGNPMRSPRRRRALSWPMIRN